MVDKTSLSYIVNFVATDGLTPWVVRASAAMELTYRKIFDRRRTKSQKLNDPRLVLQLSLSNPLKPDGKSRKKI